MQRTRPGGSVNLSKGRAGEKGRQEPYKTQRREMQSADITEGWEENKFHAWLGREEVSHEPTMSPSSKGGQQHPWIWTGVWPGEVEKQLFLSSQPLSSFAPQIQERHWSSGASWAEAHQDGCGVSICSGAAGAGFAQSGQETPEPRAYKGFHRREPGSPQCCIPAGWATTDTGWN